MNIERNIVQITPEASRQEYEARLAQAGIVELPNGLFEVTKDGHTTIGSLVAVAEVVYGPADWSADPMGKHQDTEYYP